MAAEFLRQKALVISRVNHYPLERILSLGFSMKALLTQAEDANPLDIKRMREELLETVKASKSTYLSEAYRGFNAAIAFERGDYGEAKKLLTELHDKPRDIATRSGATLLLAESLLRLGEYEEARRYVYQITHLLREVGTRFNLGYAILIRAELFLVTDQKTRAVQLAASVFYRKDRHHQLMINQATELLAKWEPELSPEAFAQAIEWGKAHDIEQVADDLLAEADPPVHPSLPSPPQPLLAPLTDREFEVLRLVASGHSNRQIAAELFLALGTVKWYVSDICSKLSVTNRTHAVTRARELNILP